MKIGGTQEHFSLPFKTHARFTEYLNEEEQLVIDDLRSGNLDIALIPFERAVLEQALFPEETHIFGTYVSTSLTWGVYLLSNRTRQRGGPNVTIGMPRVGPCAQIVVRYLCQSPPKKVSCDCKLFPADGDELPEPTIIYCESAQVASSWLKSQEIDVFLCETIKAKAYVNSGEWDQVCNFSPPWPASVFVTTPTFYASNFPVIDKLVHHLEGTVLDEFSPCDEVYNEVAQSSGASFESAREWRNITEIHPSLRVRDVDNLRDWLLSMKILKIENLEEIRQLCQLSGPISRFRGNTPYSSICDKLKLKKCERLLDVGLDDGITLATSTKNSSLSSDNNITDSIMHSSMEKHLEFIQVTHLEDPTWQDTLNQTFSAFTAMMSIHCAPNKPLVLQNLYKTLEENGTFVIEDFYLRRPLSQTEEEDLGQIIGSNNLMPKKVYLNHIEKLFDVTHVEDLTEKAIYSSKDRYTQLCAQKFEDSRVFLTQKKYDLTLKTLLDTGSIGVICVWGSKSEAEPGTTSHDHLKVPLK